MNLNKLISALTSTVAVNGDGAIDISDANLILSFAGGYINNF